MMNMDLQFEVKPPPGSSPRAEDTPRTKNLKDLRMRRLQYFEKKNNSPGSSITTESSNQDGGNSNQNDASLNGPPEVNVLASMTRDSRVTTPGSELILNQPRNIPRESTVPDSKRLYRNQPLNSGSFHELNNNIEIGGRSHLDGYTLGTKSSLPAEINHQSSNKSSQQNVNSQSSGFTLPNLSPRDSSIVNHGESNAVTARNIKNKPDSKKGKAVKGKKFKNSQSFGRSSFEQATKRSSTNDSVGVTGHSVTNLKANEMNKKTARKSVIEAEFEDDYSELGLSVDRIGYERLSGPYLPAYNPSRKLKVRESNTQGSLLKASKSAENFHDLRLNAQSEELHKRSVVADSNDFFLKRSKTHDGLANQASMTGANDSIEKSVDRQTRNSDIALNRVDLFQDTDGSSVLTSTPAQKQSMSDETNSLDNTRHDIAYKQSVECKPVVTESSEFAKSHHKLPTDDKEVNVNPKPSVIRREFESNTLESILGKDRMERLLKNLEESAWIEEEKSTDVGASFTNNQDMTLESFRSEQDSKSSHNVPVVGKSCDINELGLTTHRPSDNTDATDASIYNKMKQSADSVASSARRSTKCSFSSDQIYERARKLSTNSNEDSPSGLKRSQPPPTKKGEDQDTSFKDRDEARHLDKESNKFDYIRGIHSIKKEFYKTVAVTDSTAVSDTSLNTAKFSRQSVDSPRGQIPKPSQNAAHRRSLSVGGAWQVSCTKEEHIEGIRQHVADLRTQQLEDKISAGMPYTTSSIERYFASMEHLDLETANGFEPVPEQEIRETPREQESSNLKTISVPSVIKSESTKIRKPESFAIKGISVQEAFGEQSHKGNRSQTDSFGDGQKHGMVKKEIKSSDEKTQEEKWKNFKLDNEKRKILNQLFNEDASDDDDLFTKVTSMVDEMDGVMSSRLKSLGIDFEFLKKDTEREIERPPTNDPDIISVNLSEGSDIEPDEANSKHGDLQNKINTKSADFNKGSEKKDTNKDVQDEVEFLFRMSPRVNNAKEGRPGSSELVPEKSGEPSLSNTLKLNSNNSEGDKSLDEKAAGVSKVKVCPECAEVNKIYVTWCVECGAVLSGVDPVPCKARRETSRHVGVSTSTSTLSRSATNFKNRLEESMNNPPSASGSGWLHQSNSSFQHSQDKSFHSVDHKEVLQLKRDEPVRESDEFLYEKIESPVRALPKALQTELSLDLNSKADKVSKKKNKGEDELANLSEGINFEYSQHESPKKSLPPALQEELNLNLSLDGSHTTASFQAGPSGLNKLVRRSNDSANPLRESIKEDEGIPRAGPSGLLQLDGKENGGQKDGGIDSENTIESDDDVPIHLDETEEGAERIVYKQFVQRLMNDPRFKTDEETRPKSAVQPMKSDGRPKSSVGKRTRPQSAKVASKVRASIEKDGYQRKWGHSSTTAWSALSHGEIPSRSSLHASHDGVALQPRPESSAERPSSALRRSSGRSPNTIGAGGDMKPKKVNTRPVSAYARDRRRGQILSKSIALKTVTPGIASSPEVPHDKPTAHSASFPRSSGTTMRLPARNLMNTYAKYFEMSPRIASGEFSQWLCLPDEIWLHIMKYLSQEGLARCAQVCMQLHRIALDESLWRSIVVKKKHHFTDEWLIEIGKRQPTRLSLVQCHGENVSANGVRELFRQCSESLKELNFTGCSRGELTGDSILLHAASRCRHIAHLDASWSNVNDNGVLAVVEASDSLESVCLNGCQVITDEAIHNMVAKHGESLKTLELFGCFNVTPRSAVSISNYCKSLTILNLGQCWKLTDVSIARLAPSLTEVINLDLRGVKQMKDQTVHQLMHNCKRLQSLSLANCPSLTDVSLTGIATYCSQIQSLDLCGCKGISDMGVRALAMACHNMDYLDISSTAVTHKSVSSLASYCHTNLEVLKLNFCKHITVPSLVRLAKNCKKIRKVYLYGVNGIRHIDEVRRVNSNLWLEM